MAPSVYNSSALTTNFVLVGIVEMGTFRYLYALLAFALYFITTFLSSMIIYVTQAEQSLHEPMYILICHLVFNSMVGSMVILPKLFIDLLTACSTISLYPCLTQAFFLQSYGASEVFALTAIAYDRFLAVAHPLRYPNLMTNWTCVQLIVSIWVYVFLGEVVTIALTGRLHYCAVDINSVYCETMSLQRLACDDITINAIFGTVWSLFFMTGCMLVTVYCYIRTVLICLKLSVEASQKAMYTLVTHIMAFSIFMIATLFVIFRYRLNGGSLSVIAHVAISLSGVTTSVTFNPLIYGVRTGALRVRIVQNLQKFWGKSK